MEPLVAVQLANMFPDEEAHVSGGHYSLADVYKVSHKVEELILGCWPHSGFSSLIVLS
jgi:hypothetical protein